MSKQVYDVAVVGGGVSGMYCSLRLAENGKRVGLFEMSDRWGGRIETVLMDKGKFKAEFGPMRFERFGQVLLKKLLDELELSYSPFPPYLSAKPTWPKYEIDDPEEKRWENDPLMLLLMGVLKILDKYRPGMSADEMADEVRKLPESAYDELRRTAQQDGKLLHTRGFWNALSDALSHQAAIKIRDVGNFYHLIAENPNAIEWAIFWLRGLQPDDYLVGIKGGTKGITERLLERLEAEPTLSLHSEHRLVSLQTEGEHTRLRFANGVEVVAERVILAIPKRPLSRLAHHFPDSIQDDLETTIAFPLLKCFFVTDNPWWDEDTAPQTAADKVPTRELHYYQEHVLQLTADYCHELDSGTLSEKLHAEFQQHGITLPTTMTVEPKPNQTGWVIRGEQHCYFIRREDLSVFNKNGHGMVMLYTDRPASEYWDDYILDLDNHDRAEMNGDPRLKDRFLKYLAHALVSDPELFKEMSSENIAAELEGRVIEFGIRDWGRDPYGGAAHVWRPNSKSWEVMDRLKAFSLNDDPREQQNIHICGEAYSDYQGFIEGALRTADAVLELIN